MELREQAVGLAMVAISEHGIQMDTVYPQPSNNRVNDDKPWGFWGIYHDISNSGHWNQFPIEIMGTSHVHVDLGKHVFRQYIVLHPVD